MDDQKPSADQLLRGCIGWLEALPKDQRPDPEWMYPLWEYLRDHRDPS